MRNQHQADPDEIEQQVIAAVSSVLQDEALWWDDRSQLARITSKGKSDSDGSAANAINEEVWTKTIVARLLALGRSLRFTPNDHQRGWMFDVLWRNLNTSGDWWTTESVPLALCCGWYVSGHSGYPSTEPLDKLLIARAEHRVLICQHRYPKNVFDHFTSYVQQCEITQKKDRYLFLCYVPGDKKFHSCVFVA